MTDAAELIAELRAAGDPRNQKLGPSRELYRRAADHIETLEARVATLSAAIEPFAAAAEKASGSSVHRPHDLVITQDFYAAREASR